MKKELSVISFILGSLSCLIGIGLISPPEKIQRFITWNDVVAYGYLVIAFLVSLLGIVTGILGLKTSYWKVAIGV
jgi:hypothetical protein